MIEVLESTGAHVEADAPLERLVFWRVGGPAELLVRVDDLPTLQAVMALRPEPLTVLGKGSNALIHDAGIPGVVLQLAGELAAARVEGTRIVAGAGLRLPALVARIDRAGLCGAGAFVGIPGTVGGAVAMNAGTQLGATSDVLESAEVVLPGGEVLRLPASALRFSYRHAELPPGAVVAQASFSLSDRDVAARRSRRADFLRRRKATQPLSLPSCGSTFTNPPGRYAGQLIEAAGLKGLRRGGAQISEQHANFIVNTGGATAEDIRWLIAKARCEVRARFGIWMRPEVKLLGDWPPDALERP